jgi:hypothetical protein
MYLFIVNCHYFLVFRVRASKRRMIRERLIVSMWMETGVSPFKMRSQCFPGRSDKPWKDLSEETVQAQKTGKKKSSSTI